MTTIKLNESLLDERLSQLEEARQWSSRVISKLETFIRTADDNALFRINPLQYANEKNMAENEAIDLFLYATKFGLCEMNWHLVCPHCAHIVESFRELGSIHAHFTCNLCSAEKVTNLDGFIQVAFTVSPPVRDLIYHHPATLPDVLPIDEFMFNYYISKGTLPLPDGQSYRDAILTMTKAWVYVQPREKISVAFEAIHGTVQARDLRHNTGIAFLVGENPLATPQSVPLRVMDGTIKHAQRTIAAGSLEMNGVNYKFAQFGDLDKGDITVEIENISGEKCPLWLINLPMGIVPVQGFAPFLSGKRLLTTQTFRDLFRSDAAPMTEGIGVQDITFLFTDLKGSTAMYDAIGDPQAFFLVRQHFDTLGRVVVRHGGAIVKTIGDAVMATFMQPADAVNAALDMLKEIEASNRQVSQALTLKIGIHKGHSIAVTLNDRYDYFGQTVNIAARIQGLADANEIYVSQAVYAAQGVSKALTQCNVQPEQAAMKGVSEQMQVYRVRVKP
jgi:class 3 adenylate cyclase